MSPIPILEPKHEKRVDVACPSLSLGKNLFDHCASPGIEPSLDWPHVACVGRQTDRLAASRNAQELSIDRGFTLISFANT
jgi:hypothetical protein